MLKLSVLGGDEFDSSKVCVFVCRESKNNPKTVWLCNFLHDFLIDAATEAAAIKHGTQMSEGLPHSPSLSCA